MKHLVFSLAGAIAVFLIVSILLSLHSRDIRKVELERSLSRAAEQSLEKACISKTDQIQDNDALTADFISNFLGKLKSDGKDMDIEIRTADIYKGIISARATESYTFPNGRKGRIEADTVTIVERESRRPTVFVRYFLPPEVARDAGFDYSEDKDFIYYTLRASKGYENRKDPAAPEPEGHSFIRWKMISRDRSGNTDYIGVYS
ncbi:MAG: hypothetical protein PUF90_04465 [Lachnospiraceae bacterium]|nr:hypothetical protein [Lachnospiraceae bacterium]